MQKGVKSSQGTQGLGHIHLAQVQSDPLKQTRWFRSGLCVTLGLFASPSVYVLCAWKMLS